MKIPVNDDSEPLHEATGTSPGWSAELFSASSVFGAVPGQASSSVLGSLEAVEQGGCTMAQGQCSCHLLIIRPVNSLCVCKRVWGKETH